MHSTCQPGRPRPNSLSHAGSSGRSARQSDAVERILLALAVGVAAAVAEDRQHLVAVPARDLAERVVGGDREVQVVVDAVDRAERLQLADQVDDERDGLDGADVVVGRQDPQRGHVLAEELGLALRELDPVGPHLRRPLEQRVVDVGDVLDVGDAVAGVAPGTVEQVEADVGGGVTQVGRVVRRDPADVQPRRPVGGGRVDQLPAGRVVDLHGGPAHGQPGHVRGGPRSHASRVSVTPRRAATGWRASPPEGPGSGRRPRAAGSAARAG